MTLADSYLWKQVSVVIDRPLGSKHPKHNFVYELNYWYVPNTVSCAWEELDVYVLDVSEPLESSEWTCIGYIHRTNDDDDKLLVVKDVNKKRTKEEIYKLIHFQEQWFASEIVLINNYVDNIRIALDMQRYASSVLYTSIGNLEPIVEFIDTDRLYVWINELLAFHDIEKGNTYIEYKWEVVNQSLSSQQKILIDLIDWLNNYMMYMQEWIMDLVTIKTTLLMSVYKKVLCFDKS